MKNIKHHRFYVSHTFGSEQKYGFTEDKFDLFNSADLFSFHDDWYYSINRIKFQASASNKYFGRLAIVCKMDECMNPSPKFLIEKNGSTVRPRDLKRHWYRVVDDNTKILFGVIGFRGDGTPFITNKLRGRVQFQMNLYRDNY